MARWLALLVIVGGVILSGCQSTEAGQARIADPASPIIFQVGPEQVTLADFTAQIARDIGPGIEQLVAQGQTQAQIEQLAVEQGIRQAVFDNMVQEALLSQVARRQGIGVDAALVDEALESQLPFLVAAPGAISSTVELRRTTARQQLILEVIARNTRTDQVRSRHVLVATEGEADTLLAELAAGGDFAALAAARSIDTVSGADGGNLGWTPRGEFVTPFEDAIFNAPLNTPSKVESEFGWHVFEVLEREPNRAFENFEQLRRARNAQLFFETSFGPWYEALRRDAELAGDLMIAPGFRPDNVPLPFGN